MLKLGGTTESPMVPGELLIVRKVMPLAPGVQLKVSVALPDPSVEENEIVRGFVPHETFGEDNLADGRMTEVYATASPEATARPTSK